MNIQTIAEHSVDLDLLSGGICIDAGCRGFLFSEAMRDMGLKVIAFDLEKLTPPPEMQRPEEIQFLQMAIGTENKTAYYVDTKDQQAKYISDAGLPVQMISLNYIYSMLDKFLLKHPAIIKSDNVDIDILKMDIEGEEYRILSDPAFQPIPKQISVEFHMHCHRALHDQYYDACLENLLKWYEPVQHELTQAHGAGWNYWDSLFIRKDLL